MNLVQLLARSARARPGFPCLGIEVRVADADDVFLPKNAAGKMLKRELRLTIADPSAAATRETVP